MTEFEKAAESGEVDFMAAMQERSRMSKHVRNFARISLHLGKKGHTRDSFATNTLGLLGSTVAALEQPDANNPLYYTQMINTGGNDQLMNDPQMPEFGQTLQELHKPSPLTMT